MSVTFRECVRDDTQDLRILVMIVWHLKLMLLKRV